MDALKRPRIPTEPTTPLAKLLAEPAAAKRVTALDAFELAMQKWLAGERLDIGKLADELGVGRATLFRWVGSREQLYGEVISVAFTQTIEWAKRASTGTGAAFLTDVTRNLLGALSSSEPLRRFVAQDPELALRIVMSASSPVEGRVIAAVRALIEAESVAGHLEPSIDIDSLAYLIVRIAESFLYRDVLTGDPPDVATATKAIGLVFATQASPDRASPSGRLPPGRRRDGSASEGRTEENELRGVPGEGQPKAGPRTGTPLSGPRTSSARRPRGAARETRHRGRRASRS